MNRGGLKWTLYGDALPAWVAEMDFGLAPAITEALHDAVDAALTGYPYPDAEMAVARAASRFWSDRFRWKVDPSWVFPAPDVIEGIRRAIIHLTRPGSPVVLHTPVYFPFFGMVERAGRDVIEVRSPRDAGGRYTIDLDGVDRALDDGAGSVVVCNPWNPTGRVLTVDELADVVELARRHDARVIADEIHAAIIFTGHGHTPLATIDPERVITVTSASKAWNLPGLKCAQVVLTAERDRLAWEDFFTPEKVGVGTFGLFANEAAYASSVAWFDSTLARLEKNRDLLTSLVEEHLPEMLYHPPEGTYLAWFDMVGYGLDSPAEFFLDEAAVAMTPGAPFGTGADSFVRFNFATDETLVVEMLERIARSVPTPR
ncbi:MAG TPA: aminotransferase class I/II-fold pyridoxal phosphate-dependent enzyme [Acidimicrobiia bacterium]|nr:aminotransferase class I/II-fold pyridoxal phosphate-dependent enzyme [Acidimicrobiia bacterium]